MQWQGLTRFGSGVTLRWLALTIAILCAGQVRSEDLATNAAEPRSGSLRATSQIGVRSDFGETSGHAARRDALVLDTQLSRRSSDRSFSPGLLIECRFLDDGRKTLIAAGMLSYTTAPWAATLSPFYERTAPADGRWLYWANVRRELSPRHSLGLELYGSLETRRPSKWLLAYSANVSGPLTVSVAIGSGVGSGPDLVARTLATWRLGAARR